MKKDTIITGGRSCTVYADSEPKILLIQPTDKHELELLDKEIEHISPSRRYGRLKGLRGV